MSVLIPCTRNITLMDASGLRCISSRCAERLGLVYICVFTAHVLQKFSAMRFIPRCPMPEHCAKHDILYRPEEGCWCCIDSRFTPEQREQAYRDSKFLEARARMIGVRSHPGTVVLHHAAWWKPAPNIILMPAPAPAPEIKPRFFPEQDFHPRMLSSLHERLQQALERSETKLWEMEEIPTCPAPFWMMGYLNHRRKQK